MGFFKNFVKALTSPETIITAVVATAIAGPAGGAKAFTAKTFAIAAAKRAAITAAISSAAQSLSPRPKLGDFASFSSDATGRTQMVSQPITSRRAIYGQTRVSGPLAFIGSTDDDKYLHLVVLLAAHECQEITTVFLDDVALTLNSNGNVTAPSRYKNLVRVKKHLGGSNQAADSNLVSEVSEWTGRHRLRGIAYVYVRLESDADAFPNGIPNVSALVKGKKLYDPRDGSTAYSTNPALVIRDYLTNASYGFAADSAEIDDTSFQTAANVCDESIALAAGGTESRYTCNGTIDSANAPRQTLEALLSPCGGIMTYTNGKFGIKAAKYVSPSLTLTNDDLRGPIGVQTKRSRRDNFNAVKGVFAPPSTNYTPTDYPAITSSTFEAEDGGIQQFLDLDLPYTQSSPMAQRLAKIALFRNRQQITMDFPANLKAFKLSVGDTVQVTNDRFGFSSKVFEVADWSLVFEGSDSGMIMGVDLMLRELASSVFDWSAEEADFLQDNSTLPNPFDLTAPSMTVSDELRAVNQTAISVLKVEVASPSIYSKQFEVQAKKSTEADYTVLGIGSGNVFELLDVEDNVVYDVRSRIINGLGVRSPFNSQQHQVVGKTAPPEDVTGFSVNIIGTEAHLSWTPVGDLDLSHYRVRHARETTGATYSNSIDLAPKVSRPANTVIVPAMTGTYFIKAVDKLGLSSINATSSVAIIDEIKGFNAVATSTQNPDFAGTESDVASVDAALVLDTTLKFDHATTGDELLTNNDFSTGDFTGWTYDSANVTPTLLGDGEVQISATNNYNLRQNDISVTNGKSYILTVECTAIDAGDQFRIFVEATGGGSLGSVDPIDGVGVKHLIFTATSDSVDLYVGPNRLVANPHVASFKGFTLKEGQTFDDMIGLFDGGGGTVASSGIYDFDNIVDVGGVYTNHVTANVNVERVDYVDLFDTTSGLFDDRTGLFDGDVQAFDDTNVELQIATTENDPTITPETGLTLTQTVAAGTEISNSILGVSNQQNQVFACEVEFPRTVSDPCCLMEFGGTGTGNYIGFVDTTTLRMRFGSGAAEAPATDKVIVNVPITDLPMDGKLHTLVWEYGQTTGTGRIWVDGILVGSSTTVGYNSNIAGGALGGFISINGGNMTPTNYEPPLKWQFGHGGTLRHYGNQTVTASLPTFTEFRKFIVGDYTARGLKFRAKLTSEDVEASPKVTALSVTVDMPDRTVAEADIASGAGAKAITFSPAFKAVQGIGITASNLNSGDYYAITSKSATGFTITFYNSSDTAVDRTFDYVAKGYGEVAA